MALAYFLSFDLLSVVVSKMHFFLVIFLRFFLTTPRGTKNFIFWNPD